MNRTWISLAFRSLQSVGGHRPRSREGYYSVSGAAPGGNGGGGADPIPAGRGQRRSPAGGEPGLRRNGKGTGRRLLKLVCHR